MKPPALHQSNPLQMAANSDGCQLRTIFTCVFEFPASDYHFDSLT
jgi:hypothetical protein